MWEKNFCSLLFFIIYNHTFWLENIPFDISPSTLEKCEENAKKTNSKTPRKQSKKLIIDNKLLENSMICENEKEHSENSNFVQTLLNLVDLEDFGFQILPSDLEKLKYQFSIWGQENKNFEILVGQNSNNWEKTLITTKSLLGVIYLELFEFQKSKEPFIINKFVAKYLKISQDYLDSKNVSLIHAIITKIYPNFNLNIEEDKVKIVSEIV